MVLDVALLDEDPAGFFFYLFCILVKICYSFCRPRKKMIIFHVYVSILYIDGLLPRPFHPFLWKVRQTWRGEKKKSSVPFGYWKLPNRLTVAEIFYQNSDIYHPPILDVPLPLADFFVNAFIVPDGLLIRHVGPHLFDDRRISAFGAFWFYFWKFVNKPVTNNEGIRKKPRLLNCAYRKIRVFP